MQKWMDKGQSLADQTGADPLNFFTLWRSLANRHSCPTSAKNLDHRYRQRWALYRLRKVWSISRRYLFIHSVVSVNRSIVGYNKYLSSLLLLPAGLWHFGRPFVKRFAMVVDLDPGHIATWGPCSPRKRGHSPPPVFGPCLLWPNSWMDQDTSW